MISINISVIAVQTVNELNTKHIYQLSVSEDLLSGIIPLAVNYRIDHKYQKLLNIPLLSTGYNAVLVPRRTVIGKLQSIKIENVDVSNISWLKQN